MPFRLHDFLHRWYDLAGSGKLRSLHEFKIDDRTSRDIEGQFCDIRVQALGDDRFELLLYDNAPVNRDIRHLVESRGGVVRKAGRRPQVKVALAVRDTAFIEELAARIEELVAPGKRYKDPSWKWRCPRIAFSLRRFAARLAEYDSIP